MLFSYNMEWLIVGLETVFDTRIVNMDMKMKMNDSHIQGTQMKTLTRMRRRGSVIQERAKRVRLFLLEKWLNDEETSKTYRKYVSICSSRNNNSNSSEKIEEQKNILNDNNNSTSENNDNNNNNNNKMICTYHAGYKEALDRHTLKKFMQVSKNM